MAKISLGIVQGRLIQSPFGQLQWFPQEQWQEEFGLAAGIGIDYIELIAERDHNPNNPIWSDDGVQRIKELVARHHLSLPAFCNDYIVDHVLPGRTDVLDQNLALIERGALLGCSRYVLPLFEHSELRLDNVKDYVPSLRMIADRAARYGMTVCLETILTGAELIEVLDRIGHPCVGVVFDTGNRVAFGHDLAGDIRLLGQRIIHVHIKDKNAAKENVLLGTGLVNFLQVFQALSDIQYQGLYTFETFRGKDPLRTARFNIELVKYFHAEGFAR